MLIGQYEGKVGEKNRIAFPKKFREELGDNLIITYGYENSLIVVSEKNWRSLLEGTEGKPFVQQETRHVQRLLLGGASFIRLDSKGRFVLPTYLRDFAKIKNEIIFIGLYRYVEMWDKGIWEEYRSSVEKNISEISAKLVTGDESGE
ncbi:MAG: division/cell wall cluster transcriptional repressor MraZ [Candidatus Levybacteria bacterium RIFCSPHIGHO2_12_FULL_38_12]|nr:MAG: division/cell wall cluster transcriptional repressor MraZ [Candidatus Levybacteria bacterium RIFCSPHIGHO2_01_FULL_38_12]OGH21796.1 MAG: division/cell wall cluster transcriptional repressor MraZ [Candidatus Levybacteria bacterium RIFCSPHIGHO2_02_FULL_37_18]OGH22547.1 MAG: division/cell wall cluster transcriptional repressor MraZ [Candidatus Levybacteria bacterium RIFCSPHIGHO2_12_FULL_38_12]OGH33417.1 MAG: division/cell wall cluster transcriptional repressor MraZ [Candidatus Levybacteria b